MKIRALTSREAAYGAIPDVIEKVALKTAGYKTLLLAALHGHAGDRMVDVAPAVQVFEKFNRVMTECIRSSGPDMWGVFELYNITTESRLHQVLHRVESMGDVDGYEVRAFSSKDAIPSLTPLVIDNTDMFVGLDDSRYFRIRAAIHIVHRGAVAIGRDYFNSLWTSPTVYKIRSATGIMEDNVKSLERAIRGRSHSLPSDSRVVNWMTQLELGNSHEAVLQAFRAVEIAVRDGAQLSYSDIGTALMRKAFSPGGPLADSSRSLPEQEALAHLFAGAIGWCRNPVTHRNVELSESDARSMVSLAGLLLSIVAQQTRARTPSDT